MRSVLGDACRAIVRVRIPGYVLKKIGEVKFFNIPMLFLPRSSGWQTVSYYPQMQRESLM